MEADYTSRRPSDTLCMFRVTLVVAMLGALPVAGAEAAREQRVLDWSGYRWTVRHSVKRENPGRNLWGDSRANVRVQRDGRLRVNIVKGRSVEVVGPRMGYGRYTWVVDSDMSTADPFRVVGFFVRGVGAHDHVVRAGVGRAPSRPGRPRPQPLVRLR